MHDEKLGAIGIGTGVGHGDGAPVILIGNRFVGKFIAWSAGAIALGVAALDHKTVDDPMENCLVIKTLLCQKDKVVGGNRGLLGIELDSNIAGAGV